MNVLRDSILVKPFASDEVSKGGLIVPECYREVSNKVKVISVGTGTKKHPMRYKGGEVGYRIKDSGQEIIIEGEKHYIINQSWLLAIEN